MPTRAFGALALAVAVGTLALGLTVFENTGRGVGGAVLIALLGLICLFWPEAVDRASEAAE